MKKKLSTIFLFGLLSCMMMAQNTISGTIKDEGNGKPLPYTSIALVRLADTILVNGTVSNEQGRFEMKNIPQGNFEIKAVSMGYQTYKQTIEVEGDIDLGEIRMKQGEISLEEVQVFAKKPLFMVEGEKTLYNVSEDPSIQTGTASDALQNAPGVEVDVEGNITLRGASNVEVWINDKPSHLNAENLKTYLQQLPANSISHVEVITNPSARYGSQADGIINIVTTAKIQKNNFFSFGVNGSTRPFLLPWASYVWANEKFTINLYANGSYAHNYGSTVTSQNLFSNENTMSSHAIDTTDFNNRSLGGGMAVSVEYNIDSVNSLQLWGGYWPSRVSPQSLKGRTHREEFISQIGVYDYTTDYTSTSKYAFLYSGAFYKHLFKGDGHFLTFSVAANGNRNTYELSSIRKYASPFAYERNKTDHSTTRNASYYGEVNYNLPYSKTGTLALGLSSTYQKGLTDFVCDTMTVSNVYVMDSIRSYHYNTNILDNEAYLTMEQKFGGFMVKPGVRFKQYHTAIVYPNETDYDANHTFYHVLPSLHLSYSTKSMHNFKVSYTRRVSDPTAEQKSLFIKYDEDDFSQGNEELVSIFTNAFEAGWTKYWMKFGHVGLSAYYRGKSNEINTISEAAYDDLYGRFVVFSRPVNVGKAYHAGSELNVTYRPSAMFNLRFYANLYQSHLETQYDKTDEIKESDMFSYSFRINLWTKLWDKLEVHCSANYSSPTQTLFAERHARYSFNCGLKADFFDRKMTVFLNGMDIFNWNSYGSTSSNPFNQSSYSSRFNSRYISAGVTFRFGKMELERKARQGAEDNSTPTE